MSLEIVPIDFKAANDFVSQYHRHHKPVRAGYKFCVGVTENGKLVGVAICGLPVARALMDGFTLEVRRTCTDGTRNANSKLYGACWRIAQQMGYKKLITYTLPEESGSTLRAVGWSLDGKIKGRSWNTPSRPRVDSHPTCDKYRWKIS